MYLLIKVVLTSDSGKGTRAAQNVGKAKLFPLVVGVLKFNMVKFHGILIPSKLPQKLTAWSCCGKPRDRYNAVLQG